MKQFRFLLIACMGLFLFGCTKYQHHVNRAGDNYCLYLINSIRDCKSGACYKKGDTICVFCPPNRPGTCGARQLSKVEIVPSGDTYDLEGIGVNPTCDRCPLKDTTKFYEKK